MAKKWTLAAMLLVVIALVGSICWIYLAGLTPQPKAVTVRVGWLTGDLHDLPYFVAKNEALDGGRSLYDKYNINVTDSNPLGYVNGPAAMDAFAAGEVDIGFIGLSPAITKHLNAGVNTTIIAEVNSLGSAIVTKYPIKSMHDLIGKTIATPGPGTIQYFLLLRLAEMERIDVGNFSLIKLAPKDMRLSMESGMIDAFIAWEPYCSDAVSSNVGTIYRNSSDIWPDHICCVVVVDNKFAKTHPDAVVNFLKAHIDATNWIKSAESSGTGSSDYNLLLETAANFTGRNNAVIELALRNVRYEFEINDTFKECFIEFTQKLIQYQIVPADAIQARGYEDVFSLANKYINATYLTSAKQT